MEHAVHVEGFRDVPSRNVGIETRSKVKHGAKVVDGPDIPLR